MICQGESHLCSQSMAMKNATRERGEGGEIEAIAETIQKTVWLREIIKNRNLQF